MDRTKYEDIEPYRGERFEKAKVNLMARKEFIGAFAYMLSGDFSSVEPMVNAIESALVDVHSYDDFQHKVTAGYLFRLLSIKRRQVFPSLGERIWIKTKDISLYLTIEILFWIVLCWIMP